MDVLRQQHYDFVNLSLGPDLPMKMTKSTCGPAGLDEHFSHGKSLVTVAAGNTGERRLVLRQRFEYRLLPTGVNELCIGRERQFQETWKAR